MRTRNGPFVPSMAEVAEAASKLPNPATHFAKRNYVVQIPARVRAMCRCEYGHSLMCDVISSEPFPVLRFELRGDETTDGARVYSWMYSGGVRV